MNRIFIPQNSIIGDSISLYGDYHHQLGRVLRCRAGDELKAVCGNGFEYTVGVEKITSRKALLTIIEKKEIDREPPVGVTLYQGRLKGGGIAEILPAAVQLGVQRFIPMTTARCQGRADFAKKQKRYDKIIEHAMALSGRTALMQIAPTMNFEDALKDAQKNTANVLFWEDADNVHVLDIMKGMDLKAGDSLGVFIGPEGGFETSEAKNAAEAGALWASMGSRIIEAKHAATVALSAILCGLRDI